MNEYATNCKDVKELIDLYVSEDLEPGQADDVRMHLGRCENCRQQADAFRRQHERLASLSSAQMPNQLSPFFWQGIQREILLGEGERADGAETVAPPRRLTLRPFLYAVAALLLVVVTLYVAAAFFGGTGEQRGLAPEGDVVRAVPDASGGTIPEDVPFIQDKSLAPAGQPDTKQIEL